MKIIEVTQGSSEWFAARAGKHRASRTSDLMSTTKSKTRGATYMNYRSDLICERLTGQIEPTYTSPAMQRGIDLESKARNAFSLVQNCDVRTVGLLQHEGFADFVASPDGLIESEKALLEIKVPNTATMIDLHLTGEIPNKYILQMQAQLACAGEDYEYCYFVSYDDRLPPDLSLFIKKVERDTKLIKQIEDEACELLNDVADAVSQLKSLQQREAA